MNFRKVEAPPLMDYIERLEKLDNAARRQAIISILQEMGITPEIQKCGWLRVKNLVVDFSPERTASLLFTAHYDSVAGSPGANDNASGVSVLLGLCRELKNQAVPVRIVFFDREEAWFRTPIVRFGLLGSICYVCKVELRKEAEIYNLEFCGQGDVLAIWPVKKSDASSKTITNIEEAGRRVSIPLVRGYVPGFLMSSDHLPFRVKGIDAVTMSMLPGDKIPELEIVLNAKNCGAFLRLRKKIPAPLSTRHTAEDTSRNLDEKALQSMLGLTLEVIRGHYFR